MRHLHRSKKGDLAISTNAIVVLIIAVIMLGLIIGFVYKGFGSIEKKFREQTEADEKPAPTPSAQSPITLSANLKIADQGALVGLKVNILNTGDAAVAAMKPGVECTKSGVIDTGATEDLFPKSVEINKYADYVYTFKLADNAPVGRQLCRIKAFDGSTELTDIKPAEFNIDVEG